jgi:hypothetical protein
MKDDTYPLNCCSLILVATEVHSFKCAFVLKEKKKTKQNKTKQNLKACHPSLHSEPVEHNNI